MIMMSVFRIFQVYYGLPDFDDYFALVQKFTWITIAIQYFIVGLAYIADRRAG